MLRTREKGQTALSEEHSFIETWHEQHPPNLNLVAELSGVRSGIMLLVLCAMALACFVVQVFPQESHFFSSMAKHDWETERNRSETTGLGRERANEALDKEIIAYMALREEVRLLQNVSDADGQDVHDKEMRDMLAELEDVLSRIESRLSDRELSEISEEMMQSAPSSDAWPGDESYGSDSLKIGSGLPGRVTVGGLETARPGIHIQSAPSDDAWPGDESYGSDSLKTGFGLPGRVTVGGLETARPGIHLDTDTMAGAAPRYQDAEVVEPAKPASSTVLGAMSKMTASSHKPQVSDAPAGHPNLDHPDGSIRTSRSKPTRHDSITSSSPRRSAGQPKCGNDNREELLSPADTLVPEDPNTLVAETPAGDPNPEASSLVAFSALPTGKHKQWHSREDVPPNNDGRFDAIREMNRLLQSRFRRWQDVNLHRKDSAALTRRQRRLQERRRKVKAGRVRMNFIARMCHWASTKWVMLVIMNTALLAAVMYMFPGGMRPQTGAGPRTHAHIGDAGPPFLGTATIKVPPAWSIERNQHYTLRSWISDLILWSAATDVEPRRMGAIAALQVSGSAKELVREIPPETLANGGIDPVTNQQLTGLMMLVQTLARRYMPLDQEVTTRAISDFMNFDRIPGESIDALLVRFDVLRVRAQQRGGLGVNHGGLSWLLLRALRLNAEQTDRLLQFLGGALPQDDVQMGQLIERIRRQGHIFEGGLRHPPNQAATGDPGIYHANAQAFFPTFPSNAPACSGAGFGFDAGATAGHACAASVAEMSGAANAFASVQADISRMSGGEHYHAHDDSIQCERCGIFYEDDDMSSATESDTGSQDPDAVSYATVNVDGQMRQDDDARANTLYQDYIMARRRWRRYSAKPPRRYRRSGFKPSVRMQGKLERGPYARTYAAFLPSSAFAGNKGGKGGGKGFVNRRATGSLNPRGKDGQVLRCASVVHSLCRCHNLLSP